jgi:hypothetical protein
VPDEEQESKQSTLQQEEAHMCPFCLATAALLAVSTASTGGLTAFAMNKYFRARNSTQKNNPARNSSELKAKENAS